MHRFATSHGWATRMAPKEVRKCAHAATLRNIKLLPRYDLGALALRAQRRCLHGLLKLHLPEQRRVGLAYRQRFGAMLEPQMNAPTEVSLHARDLRKVHDD